MIALYGGSFDPVHNAHVEVVRHALTMLKPEKLYVIPCHLPPHKSALNASVSDRLAMLKCAFGSMDVVEIDTREIESDRVSYTYETAAAIRREVGDHVSICFVVGWDSWLNFTSWKCWQGILSTLNLVVVRRPGVNQQAGLEQSHKVLENYVLEHQVSSVDISKHAAGKIVMLDTPEMEIAAETIREDLANGRDIRDLVPAPVYCYIREKHLYSRV